MRPITTLRAIFLFALLSCGAVTIDAQSSVPCPAGDCACILYKADQAATNPKTFSQALDLYFAVTSCDETKAETVEKHISDMFLRIEQLRKAEEKAKKVAEVARKIAIREKAKADSTASAALIAARRAYANDLAYKSTIALRDGDRNTAFRLAEFAHRYVEADNPKVVQALIDALYYFDNPDPARPLLPRVSNLEGHADGVLSVAFSPDGKKLATGSEDNTAKIWDLESGKALTTLEGHTFGVLSVAFSPDGKILATGSGDKTAKIWDLESGKALTTLESHTEAVSSVAFSPDGKRLATGSHDKTAKIWDLESGKALTTLQGHSYAVLSVAFSPDGKKLATGSVDNTAKIWDLESGKALTTLQGHSYAVW
ncbi:MAG: WD40 repeat domain-containing protein, partial [Saprospiraceae bacterium]